MTKPALTMCALLICLAQYPVVDAAAPGRRLVIYDEVATEVSAPPARLRISNTADLWITLADLTRATKFVLKPEGMCRDELCFPIPKNRKRAFLRRHGSKDWFNLSEFARLVRQPVAFEAESATWYFGPRADEQNGYLATLKAPDFKLPDSNGKLRSLSDFRGKKVLLLTWASW